MNADEAVSRWVHRRLAEQGRRIKFDPDHSRTMLDWENAYDEQIGDYTWDSGPASITATFYAKEGAWSKQGKTEWLPLYDETPLDMIRGVLAIEEEE